MHSTEVSLFTVADHCHKTGNSSVTIVTELLYLTTIGIPCMASVENAKFSKGLIQKIQPEYAIYMTFIKSGKLSYLE